MVYVYHHYVDFALLSSIAWNVMVTTLEVNDFHHRLLAAFAASSSFSSSSNISISSSSSSGERDGEGSNNSNNSNNSNSNSNSNSNTNNDNQLSSNRYIAALVAIRYGIRDAIFDWFLIYTAGWAVVGIITWENVEPNSLLVIWGFSLMLSAVIIGNSGLRIPQWLGYYHRSQFQFLKDTSDLAPRAVQTLSNTISSSSNNSNVDDASSSSSSHPITTFRHQVRLGVGRHFSHFTFILLPFYVNLKPWAYLLSIFLGLLFGLVYLRVVFECRRRYKSHHRGQRVGLVVVIMGASFFLSVVSAAIFMWGMQVVEKGWKRSMLPNDHVLLLSFFGWLAMCLLLQGLKYYEQRLFADEEETKDERVSMFEDCVIKEQNDTNIGTTEEDGLPSLSTTTSDVLEEPLVQVGRTSTGRRAIMNKDSTEARKRAYFYQTAYFTHGIFRKDRTTLNNNEINTTPHEIYDSCIASEEADTKWYLRAWMCLPFQPAWNLVVLGTMDIFRCCCCNRSDFAMKSSSKKIWLVAFNVLAASINLVALLLAVIACGSAIQAKTTKSKLEFVREIYNHLDAGPVCAYDHKCGEIETFANRGEAHAANYTVAHCGKCSSCSTWNDLELQWSTRTNAAEKSQRCGLKSFTGGREAMLTCLETEMGMTTGTGWTKDCAEAWAQSIECAKENCVFIAIQAKITNRLGNFSVSPDSITPATCNEAQCEQGNPGRFSDLSGASRRKMNIKSSIPRPLNEQCQIVDDIPKDDEGYNDWGLFFDPPFSCRGLVRREKTALTLLEFYDDQNSM